MAKILIVDDCSIFSAFLAELLHRNGHEPHTTCDGRAALERLAESRFELVVTDIFMPEFDGIELIRRIRDTDAKVPVIAVTGGPRERADCYLRAMRLFGVSAAFVKPFDLGAFMRKVDRLLAA